MPHCDGLVKFIVGREASHQSSSIIHQTVMGNPANYANYANHVNHTNHTNHTNRRI